MAKKSREMQRRVKKDKKGKKAKRSPREDNLGKEKSNRCLEE